MTYVMIKVLHVLSSTVLFGTGIGSAWYFLLASLDAEPRVIARVAHWVVLADALFTATTAIVQPVTGWWMAKTTGFAFTHGWLAVSIVLYAIAIATWLPVVALQIRMRDIARAAANANQTLPPAFRRCLIAWIALGVIAFFAFVGIFYLMIAKPF